MMWPPPMPAAPPEPGVPTKSSASLSVPGDVATGAVSAHDADNGISPLTLAAVGVVLLILGLVVPSSEADAKGTLLSHLTVFMLACFVGFQVVWSVKPALHTPLMSVTNAISGIILVGGMLQLSGELNVTTILGAVAVLIATINIVGGFMVTNRMLAMFRK
jgi:NAD(P) transhydrogenase subunit alpha